MVLFTSFQYFLIQNDVHFVNYCYVLSKTDDKAGYALGHGHLVIYTLLYEHTVTLPLVRNGFAQKNFDMPVEELHHHVAVSAST